MSFFQSADAYDRFMGRYSRILSPAFADFAGVGGGMRVLDVGCGPGILTAELVDRVGAERVSAVDPAEPFVEAVRTRFPGVAAQVGTAESLSFGDDEFDAALCQLVVHFMTDPAQGIREMARVTRPGGTVAACTWDIAGGRSPLSPFWRAVHTVNPDHQGEADRPGVSEASLTQIFTAAGLDQSETAEIEVAAEHASFDEWWQPFESGVGPTGAYLATLTPVDRAAVRDAARQFVPDGPHTAHWYVWAARAVVA